MTYRIEDFQQISFNGFDYQLPPSVVNTVNHLLGELAVFIAAESTETTPTFTTNAVTHSKYRRPTGSNIRNNKPKEASWINRSTFKATQIEKKEGNEKTMNDIRVCLNKISNKNYDVQRDAIIEHIRTIVDENSSTVELQKISSSIFDIASTNKFYSDLYADLYKELIAVFSCFQESIDRLIERYMTGMLSIQYVNPDTNYDKFCDNNKANDQRKALAVFIMNLVKKEVFGSVVAIDIIVRLQGMVMEYISTEDKTNEVDEITENLFLLITNGKIDDTWANIVDTTKRMSMLKAKEYKSLSSRAVFKYMDIMDQITKNK